MCLRSGDVLAGIAAENEEERIRAQMALADVPLKRFLSECVVPYETDEVTRLIMDSHDAQAFAPVSSFTVGQLRDWLLDDVIARYDIPTQSCVLTHVTNTLEMIRRGVPVDLCFQSIAGTEKANASFGISLSLLDEAWDATLSLKRGTVGDNVMYFETGQGSALSAGAHFGVDQQTLECRVYAVARRYRPLLVNTVVGFIGPEYLFNGKQIIRAGLEDHCCGKLLGLPMGEDVCYTNHAEADQDDMDMLLTLLGVAGCNFVMGIPGADDIMLGYQSTSFHDVAWLRRVLGKRPAPEFEAWLERMGILSAAGELLPPGERRGMAALGRELEEGGHGN